MYYLPNPLPTEESRIYEIIFPENRIVLDYKGKRENIFLGVVDHKTGLIVWRATSYNAYEIMTLGDALALPIPEGEEGYVLDILDDDLNTIDHLKLKGDWYVRMHAAIFGLTEKRVWEAWSLGQDHYFEELPDELQGWALAVAHRLDSEYAALGLKLREAFDAIRISQKWERDRKGFAIAVMKGYAELSGGLFAMWDGDDEKYMNWIDKKVKPQGHVPYSSTTVKEFV